MIWARKILKIVSKNYIFFLIFIVFISYGQILWMQPWQDDNAMFFKLAHIQEPAGFLGKGPFGEGVYKYAVTPFIPIFKLLGYYIPAYFALALVLYIVTTLVIYKSLSFVLGEKGGKIASFIYASGYVVSDGVWRLANSVTTSISIIIANLFLVFYWKFYKDKKIIWYALAFLCFFASLEFELSRMHYFVAVVVFFEVIFLAFKNGFKSLFSSALRLLPFLALFKLKVLGNDPRSTGTTGLALEILKGKFESLTPFLSSLANLVIPDWLTNYFVKGVNHDFFIFIMGGILVIFFIVVFLKLETKARRLFLFFLLWLLANLYAYASYIPIAFDTTNRYLAHSFFALTAIFAILFVNFDRKKLAGGVGIFLIIALAFGNLVNVFALESNILKTRSLPVKKFYGDIKISLPKISKGDILYFDVSSSQSQVYKDAVSAAMMPDSTSYAWRYGTDRYDLNLVDDFSQLSHVFEKDKVNPETIHSFLYSDDGLIETSGELRDYFSNNVRFAGNLKVGKESNVVLNPVRTGTNWLQPDVIFNLDKPIDSVGPVEMEFTIKAREPSLSEIKFPLFFGDKIPGDKTPWKDEDQRNLALEYQSQMREFVTKSTFEVNSEWRGNSVKNLYDNDPGTFWQSDRVIWQKKDDYVKIKLPRVQSISGIAWMNNTYSGSIPVSYEIDVSLDGETWRQVKKITDSKVPEGQNYQEVTFAPTPARLVMMRITDTLGGDSPMISEFRVIPANLASLDLAGAQEFLSNPFLYVPDIGTFQNTVLSFAGKGKVKIYWMGNKEKTWLTDNDAGFDVFYDGKPHNYKVKLPPGGTNIDKIKIADISIPGELAISDINFRGLNFNENH